MVVAVGRGQGGCSHFCESALGGPPGFDVVEVAHIDGSLLSASEQFPNDVPVLVVKIAGVCDATPPAQFSAGLEQGGSESLDFNEASPLRVVQIDRFGHDYFVELESSAD